MDQGVGREVKRLREARGWSRTKLAAEADMSASGVSMIENGQRNLTTTTLAKLAGALGVGITDLFPKDQPPLPDFTEQRRGESELEEARQPRVVGAEEMIQEEGPFYTAYEAAYKAQGHILAGVWRRDLARWDEDIPAGTIPEEFAFGQLIGWVLSIKQSRDIYEGAAQDFGLKERKEMRDTLEMLRDVEREAVRMARRAIDPVKTYAEFRKIWEANDMDTLTRRAERR